MAQDAQARSPTINVNNLSYAFPDGSSGLEHVSLALPAGSRTLLVGANGAGKTTLLRLLSGKRLAPRGTVSIGGVDPFKEGLEAVTYLGLEWVLNPIVRTDIYFGGASVCDIYQTGCNGQSYNLCLSFPRRDFQHRVDAPLVDVITLLASVGGDYYSERRDALVEILDIDLSWRMHAVSDGERRRVQLAMGLIRPASVLLLDELTADLDLLSRSNLLTFLQGESQNKGTTIVYATHILDNLSQWPTHLVHMHLGSVKEWGPTSKWYGDVIKHGKNSELGELVLQWLKDDIRQRGPRSQRASEGKTYESHEGKGGYGNEKRSE